jgi:hypothetical protein
MNAEQVIKLADFNARELGLKWIMTSSQDIRLKRENELYCPIEVAGNFMSVVTASSDLGLLFDIASLVLCAADNIVVFSDNPREVLRLRELMVRTFEFEGCHVSA